MMTPSCVRTRQAFRFLMYRSRRTVFSFNAILGSRSLQAKNLKAAERFIAADHYPENGWADGLYKACLARENTISKLGKKDLISRKWSDIL